MSSWQTDAASSTCSAIVSLTARTPQGFGNALTLQVVGDGLGTLQGELLVDGSRTGIVGVALDLDVGVDHIFSRHLGGELSQGGLGGGGAANNKGGSGVVIIRYELPYPPPGALLIVR